MEKKKLIQIAHDAQHDAGGLNRFSDCFSIAENLFEDYPTFKIDPVACFLAAVMHNESNSESGAVESLEYYHAELTRAIRAIQSQSVETTE